MSGAERPLCKCHGEPQVGNGYRPNGTKKWSCVHKRRAYSRRRFEALGGVAYNWHLLRTRRNKALMRRRRRET